jgi:hypothetical protein
MRKMSALPKVSSATPASIDKKRPGCGKKKSQFEKLTHGRYVS